MSSMSCYSPLKIAKKQLRGRLLGFALMVVLLGIVLLSYTQGGIIHILLRWDITTAEKVSLVEEYFLSWGYLAHLVYVGVVVFEVIVAPIPGTILYAPGGMIFGGLIGGSLSLLGNVLGAGICHKIAHVLGKSFVESHLAAGCLDKYKPILSRQGIWIILLLRVNPFTSSDLVSYAAGFMSIPAWKVMLGTFLGMMPLCYLQAYLAEGIFKAFPFLVIPVLMVCVAYVLYFIWIVKKLSGRRVMYDS
jgi:uncharacterized membrane protein YdjX (TVP38/TMEM64 family)